MSENKYIFEIEGWKARLKKLSSNYRPTNNYPIYTLYHDCDFGTAGLDCTKWGFNYVSKGTTICPFCRNKIPDEIIFLLEMIK